MDSKPDNMQKYVDLLMVHEKIAERAKALARLEETVNMYQGQLFIALSSKGPSQQVYLFRRSANTMNHIGFCTGIVNGFEVRGIAPYIMPTEDYHDWKRVDSAGPYKHSVTGVELGDKVKQISGEPTGGIIYNGKHPCKDDCTKAVAVILGTSAVFNFAGLDYRTDIAATTLALYDAFLTKLRQGKSRKKDNPRQTLAIIPYELNAFLNRTTLSALEFFANDDNMTGKLSVKGIDLSIRIPQRRGETLGPIDEMRDS